MTSVTFMMPHAGFQWRTYVTNRLSRAHLLIIFLGLVLVHKEVITNINALSVYAVTSATLTVPLAGCGWDLWISPLCAALLFDLLRLVGLVLQGVTTMSTPLVAQAIYASTSTALIVPHADFGWTSRTHPLSRAHLFEFLVKHKTHCFLALALPAILCASIALFVTHALFGIRCSYKADGCQCQFGPHIYYRIYLL